MADTESVTAARGPTHPTPTAAVAHRPLDGRAVRLTGGLLARVAGAQSRGQPAACTPAA